MMHTSAQGHALLHYFESCRLTAYPDPATGGAPWTIGWGDTGPGVVYGLTITQEQADARFATRLADEFEPGVRAVLTAPPEQHQFDAMVCLAYNIGLGNFRKSSDKKNSTHYILTYQSVMIYHHNINITLFLELCMRGSLLM